MNARRFPLSGLKPGQIAQRFCERFAGLCLFERFHRSLLLFAGAVHPPP